MATSLLALLDDITTVLDDVALLSKVAAQKTAGVVGDDLALNARQVAGVRAERELPVVWAVAKGSLLNKAILVPVALAIGALMPALIVPSLMVGGAYLCFEGFEKLAHAIFAEGDEDDAEHARLTDALRRAEVDLVAFEREKIRGAIRTDFVLSAEIIVIALGTVAEAALPTQMAVVSGVALLMTVGVYGVVAAIVKLDDMGLYLSRRRQRVVRAFGRGVLRVAPWLMKLLGVVGTVAMFLVGGGILVHGTPLLREAASGVTRDLEPLVEGLVASGFDAMVGVIAGAVALAGVAAVRRFRRLGRLKR